MITFEGVIVIENYHGNTLSHQNKNKSDFHSHLPTSAEGIPKKKIKVGIVTPEVMGVSHGGIGTSYDALAEALANDGNLVTLLFVPLEKPRTNLYQKCKKDYAKKNISLELFPLESLKNLQSLWTNAKRSYGVMQWLLRLPDYDILHFPDWKGLGYYPALAKHLRMGLTETTIVVGTHSSTFWDASYSYGDKAYYQDFVERNYLEGESVRLSDFVVSPSQYYLDWLKNAQHWILPNNSYVQPNIMKSELATETGTAHRRHEKPLSVKEIVFFGRLEKRKGLVLFCDALDHPDLYNRKDISVSFMGTITYIDGKTAHEYIKERSLKWKFPWKIIPAKKRDDALSYLREPGKLALIPSLSETMSYTVLECLWAEIPFLASRVGGIPELIASCDLDRVTFEPIPENLSSALCEVLDKGTWPSVPSFDIRENEKSWVDWHQYIASTPPKLESPKEFCPTISVCLVSIESRILPDKVASSLNSQDYPKIEVIFVGSKHLETLGHPDKEISSENSQKKTWKFFSTIDPDIFTAKNLAAKNATGDYLFFLDTDVQMNPHTISDLVSSIRNTTPDILTFAQTWVHESDQESSREEVSFHLGNCFSLGALHNVFGDSNMLVKKSVFNELSGFSEHHYAGDPLWEFYAKASTSGYKIKTNPVPLLRKELTKQMRFVSPKFIRQHPYLSGLPPQYHELFNFVQASRFFHDPAPDGSFTEGFVNRPQEFVDEYWNSKPWRYILPITNFTRKLFKLPEYRYPRVTTLTEALNAVRPINESFLWNIAVQVIKFRRILKKK